MKFTQSLTRDTVSKKDDTSVNILVGGLSLRINFTWTLIGNLVYAASQWGMLIVLAKLGTPEAIGQFALGLAITAPIITFANLALRAVQATDADRRFLFVDYLGLRLITTGLALLVIGGITFVTAYRLETALVILVIGLAKAFEAVSDIFYGLFQQHEYMSRIAKSMMIKGPLSLVALSLGTYLTGKVLWGAVGLAIAWALILIVYDIRNGVLILKAGSKNRSGLISQVVGRVAVSQLQWIPTTLGQLVQLTLPLGFATMLLSLYLNMPRYFIERYLGERELGFFASLAYVMMAGLMIVNALGESASPRLAKYYAQGNSTAFRSLLLKLVGVGILLGGAGILAALALGREILTLLYQPEYAAYTNVFIWLMVTAAMLYLASILGYGMTAAHYFKIQPIIFIVIIVLSIVFCFVLVPKYGLLGAAWVMGITTCFHAVMVLVCDMHAIHTLNRRENKSS